MPAPKKHPVVFPQELAIAYNSKCGILKLKNLIQVYDQISPSGDHCLSNKLWFHKNLSLIMCDNQLYAVPYDLFLCGSSNPVYTYLRDFLDPHEMKLQGNTVNQQAHQYLRYFFKGSRKWLKLLLLRVQWRQNIYMDWSTIWSKWKIRSSWSRILISSLSIVNFSGPRTEQCHKIPNIPNLSRIRMFREDPKGWDTNWT